MNRLLFFIVMTSFILADIDCVDGRYSEEIFDVSVQYGIEFGENTNEDFWGNDYTQTMYMDVYEPEGDDFPDRPLIIFMFGGSFVSGSRTSGDIVSLCTNYASMGYVAVAIDYRLTQNIIINSSEEKAYEAVIKAIQDLKAAIRYFRMNDELYDDYRIDSDRVFVGGVSAGAIASLNSVYLNSDEEAMTLVTQDHLQELGGLEGSSGNPGYPSHAHGVVNLCGAIGRYEWIQSPDVPIVSMHGDQDEIVPYSDNMVTLFGLNVEVYGSYIIHQTMTDLGNYSALYTYEGQGHVPFTNMNLETEFSSDFLYSVVCDDSDLLLGDINGDSGVDVLDVIILVNFIVGNEDPNDEQIIVSDLNDDQEVNVLDVIALVNIILDS